MKILFIVFQDNLVNKGFLNHGGLFVSYKNKENKVHDEGFLLIKIEIILVSRDFKGIHGNGVFL